MQMPKPDDGTALLLGTLVGTMGLFILAIAGIFPWSLTAALLAVIMAVMIMAMDTFPRYPILALIVFVPIIWALSQPDPSRDQFLAYLRQTLDALTSF